MDIQKIIQETKDNKALIIDVRRDDEWNEGHIKGALHYELDRILQGEVPLIPKNTLIYTHCKSGGRATQAQEKLSEVGFTNVVCLGGYSDWKNAGGEVVE